MNNIFITIKCRNCGNSDRMCLEDFCKLLILHEQKFGIYRCAYGCLELSKMEIVELKKH